MRDSTSAGGWILAYDRGGRVAYRAITLLVSVARPGEPDRATARRVRVRGRRGVTSLRVPPATAGPYVVTASAFAKRGSRSAEVRASIR